MLNETFRAQNPKISNYVIIVDTSLKQWMSTFMWIIDQHININWIILNDIWVTIKMYNYYLIKFTI